MDLTRLGGTEKALSGAGVLLFIFSFLPWFEVTEFGLSLHADAWSWPSGFTDWFPVMLLFGYAIVLALPAFGVAVRIAMLDSAANRALVGFVLSVFAALMFAVQGLTYPGSGFGYSAGPAWAYFISLLIVVASTGRSYLGFKQQGGSFAGIGAALQSREEPPDERSGGTQQRQVPRQPTYQTRQSYQEPYPGQQNPEPPPYPDDPPTQDSEQ